MEYKIDEQTLEYLRGKLNGKAFEIRLPVKP